jgi:hypothetical protein
MTVQLPQGALAQEIDAWHFNSGDDGVYTVDLFASITFLGTGIDVFGAANITVGATGDVSFRHQSSAGNASYYLKGAGTIQFFDDSDGGLAAFYFTDDLGVISFASTTGQNNDGKISMGSLAGAGTVDLGSSQTLTVGGDNF